MSSKYLKIVKVSAWYDLIVTAPFAFPFTANLSINSLAALHGALGFSGEIPQFQTLHLLFMNLMGSIVLVWSVLRIKHTSALLGLYDAYARILFSIWMIYALVLGATPLIFLFLIPEMLWGIIQFYGYRKREGSELHAAVD